MFGPDRTTRRETVMNLTFKEEFEARRAYAQRVIEEGEPIAGSFDKEIIEAMNYSVLVGGKRLRPILIHSFYRLYGGDGELDTCFMQAMELLHTYSLVHDDLPAIDNDAYRRGQLTTHKKFGEATAILAGDGLLHEAYELILRAVLKADEKDRTAMLGAFAIFGEKSGIHGMLGGQAADVIHNGEFLSDDLMMYVYEYKTGALIEGSMMIGAALAGAGKEELTRIERIGSLIGLAFQIRDDILDLTGDEAVLGKPVLSDERNLKKTFVSVHGLSESEQRVCEMTKEAKDALACCGSNASEREFIAELFDYLTKRVN